MKTYVPGTVISLFILTACCTGPVEVITADGVSDVAESAEVAEINSIHSKIMARSVTE
jgi:hypothetical protein